MSYFGWDHYCPECHGLIDLLNAGACMACGWPYGVLSHLATPKDQTRTDGPDFGNQGPSNVDGDHPTAPLLRPVKERAIG